MNRACTSTTGYLPRAAIVTLVLVALCAWPVWKLFGETGLYGLLAGAGAALVGALLGHLPRFFIKPSPHAMVAAGLIGVGVRLFATLILAGLLLLLVPLPREPVAIGLVLTYLSLLALEVRDLIRLSESEAGTGEGAQEGADGAPTS
jgi:hypothetical protein